MTWRGLVQWLSFWGVWPALLMVLCQQKVALLLNTSLAADVVLLTLAGTLAIYGLDRSVERHIQTQLAHRHLAPIRFNGVMIALVALIFTAGLLQLHKYHLIWLAGLGLSGFAYLLLTWGKLPPIFCLKELMGAWCFTFLVWGCFPWERPGAWLAFFLMGLANFLMSSFNDRKRDHANALHSTAIQFPRATVFSARVAAILAAGLFLNQTGFDSFFYCALAHALFPLRQQLSVDWAFLPMLTVMISV